LNGTMGRGAFLRARWRPPRACWRSGSRGVALVAAVAVSALLPTTALAQGGTGNATEGAAQGAGEWPGAWVILGIILAATAIGGTIWNGLQIARHVGLVERDMATRLRPILGWASDGDRRVWPPSVREGKVHVIKILNAGPVAAMGIVLDVRFGTEGDFQAGKAGHMRNQWGTLAPNSAIHLNVHMTGEQERRAKEKREKFCVEIKAEYRGPDGKGYEYSMGGDYDGREMLLRD